MSQSLSILSKRCERLIGIAVSKEIDAFAVVPGANFTYLTGLELHLMERPTIFVVCKDGSRFAIMPSLEEQKWSEAMPDVETFYWKDAEGPDAAFAWLADQCGPITLGVEGLRMRMAEYSLLVSHWHNKQVINADVALAELRMLKDKNEVVAEAVKKDAKTETLEVKKETVKKTTTKKTTTKVKE